MQFHYKNYNEINLEEIPILIRKTVSQYLEDTTYCTVTYLDVKRAFDEFWYTTLPFFMNLEEHTLSIYFKNTPCNLSR